MYQIQSPPPVCRHTLVQPVQEAASPRLRRRTRVWHGVQRLLFMSGGILLFILALYLLKEGAGIYGSTIVGLLNVSNPLNALGFGWLLSYVFLSGSPVAAVAISFFSAGTISGLQTFMMITGSRLGASFIVLFVGFLYFLRGYRHPASISTGVLALLTTAAIYLPAMLPGYWLLSIGWPGDLQMHAAAPVDSGLDLMLAPLLGLITSRLPEWMLLPCGAVVLLAGFQLLDRALPQINPENSSFRRIGRLIYRPGVMFLVGAAFTTLTLSVSVSIGLLVPLSVKGLVRRENILPYIMGANVTTFIDTLVAALIVGGTAAFAIVLVEVVSVSVLSLLVLVCCYRPFEVGILRTQELVVRSKSSLAIFLIVMLLVPLLLLLVPG